WPLAARAQQSTMALVGLLSGAQRDDREISAVRQGLKDAGYVEAAISQSNIARPMVASTDCQHWPPIWWPTRWLRSLRSPHRLQWAPKLQPQPSRSFSRRAPTRLIWASFPVSTDPAAM